jgi:hypothetical protein
VSLFRKCMIVAALAMAAMLAAVGNAAAAPRTPPGGDAAYQVEISANVGGPNGGGSWYWLELDKDGGGIYAGSDCAHGVGASGARGALSWEQLGDQLIIHGVVSPGATAVCVRADPRSGGLRPLRRDVRRGPADADGVSHLGRGRRQRRLRAGAGSALTAR